MNVDDDNEGKVKCDICGKFYSRRGIKNHMNAHEKKKAQAEKLKANKPIISTLAPSKSSVTSVRKINLYDEIAGKAEYVVPSSESIKLEDLYEMEFNSDDDIDYIALSVSKLKVDNSNNSGNNNDTNNKRNVDDNDTSTPDITAKKKRNQPELAVQKKMEKKLGGTHKTTPLGIIDIFLPDQLVEIKCWNAFHHGIGQLICYHHYYPNHMMHLHLFGDIPPDEKRIPILTVCAENHIKVTWEK